jgi:hypothetical protein
VLRHIVRLPAASTGGSRTPGSPHSVMRAACPVRAAGSHSSIPLACCCTHAGMRCWRSNHSYQCHVAGAGHGSDLNTSTMSRDSGMSATRRNTGSPNISVTSG